MALISLAGITEAIDNLNIREATLKGQLLHAIRTQFPNEESLDTVTAIDPLNLIHQLWAPKTAAEIKAKRKNLSSLKSSINKNLKQGIKGGANPEGLIIGRDNVFIISDEKKNLLLDRLTLTGDDSQSLARTLAALNDMLSGMVTSTGKDETLKILDQLDTTRKTLAKLAGLSDEDTGKDKSPGAGGDDDQTPKGEPEVNDSAVTGFPGEENEITDDWDSFEVIDDDFDIIDGDDPVDLGVEGETEAIEDLEIIDGVDDVLEAEADLGPMEEIDGEEVELAGDVEEIEEEELADDWDSLEVIDDDFDIIDGDDPVDLGVEGEAESIEKDLEIIDGVDDVLEAEADLGSMEEIDGEELADDWDSLEVVDDDDFDIMDEDDLAGLEEEDITAADPGVESGQDPAVSGQGQGQVGSEDQEQRDNDDWDSFEVVDDDLDLSQPADTQKDQGTGSQAPPMERSMDLSQYIDPEEALVTMPDILQENNDEYVRQILERFMPKFIKIPAGTYAVGGPKKRRTDRAATTINLAEFYIGQLPITNDLFDFFVRETGYQTEAEQQGHGLVTSGRLRSGLRQKTGRQTMAINKGIITRQVPGANWRHPEGPGSSLENRGQHPVVQVSRLDTKAFASWSGKRLPSEDEWEAAARGLQGFLFPWGNESLPLANLEGHQAGCTTPVIFFGRQSLSPLGLLDMLGNVFEWTSSNFASRNNKELAILKGGSWATSKISSADRLIEPATTWSNTIGFRCAVDGD